MVGLHSSPDWSEAQYGEILPRCVSDLDVDELVQWYKAGEVSRWSSENANRESPCLYYVGTRCREEP